MRLPCVIVAALSVTAVRIPAQSRFSAIEDARVEALVDQKTKSLRKEVEELKRTMHGTPSNADPPRFEQKQKHQETWKNLGVPQNLIDSLQELVDAFKQEKTAGPKVPPSYAKATNPESVANMITQTLQSVPEIQPDLMQRMMDNYKRQADAMQYIANTQPHWLQPSGAVQFNSPPAGFMSPSPPMPASVPMPPAVPIPPANHAAGTMQGGALTGGVTPVVPNFLQQAPGQTTNVLAPPATNPFASQNLGVMRDIPAVSSFTSSLMNGLSQ